MSEEQKREYRVERLNKGNITDVARLHSEVYGVAVANDYFQKKYDTAYTGTEDVGFIAYNHDHIPIAFYGVIPCFIEYSGKTILAAQSADTMTHPGFRFKGMFVELSNLTFELCRKLDIRLLFGFPNQNSYHGAINKLGWKMTGSMKCFLIPVKCLPLASVAQRFSFLARIYKRYVNVVLHNRLLDQAGVTSSVLANGFGGVCRSKSYLEYKCYNTTHVIGVKGAKAWVNIRNGMIIGDLEGVTEADFKKVMAGLIQIAKWIGVTQIQFHSSQGTKLYEQFEANYESRPSYPVLFQDFGSVISPEMVRFTFADIDIF